LIIENLLPKSYQEDLIKIVHDMVGWQLSSVTSGGSQGMNTFTDNNTIDSIQFVNVPFIYGNENFLFPKIKPMLYCIEDKLNSRIKNLARIKINHTAKIPNFAKDNYNIPHADDGNPNLLSLIYYINDSDGDTFFFDEEFSETHSVNKLTLVGRITPRMGRAVVFPARKFHAGSNPINNPSRFVINFVFELENGNVF
jgi:hypothetical protein